MSTPGAHLRMRKFAPKVRSGCLTCKRRRVKCDEQKPVCTRCLNLDLRCEFKPLKTWMFSPDTGPRLTEPCDSCTGLPFSITQPYGSANERLYLNSFLQLTAPWLAKYAGRELFEIVIPQLSWAHAAVRHSLIAVTVVAEKSRTSFSSFDDGKGTFHYNEAIRALYNDKAISEEFILICCILFWIHDNITRNLPSALTHLHGGFKILSARRKRIAVQQDASIISSCIEPTFIEGLAFSAATVAPVLDEEADPKIIEEIRQKLQDPNYFSKTTTMQQLSSDMTLCGRSLKHAIGNHAPDEHGTIQYSRPLFSELRAFRSRYYRASQSLAGLSSMPEIHLLKSHDICIGIILDLCEYGPDIVATRTTEQYLEDILDQIEQIEPAYFQQKPNEEDLAFPLIPILTFVVKISQDQKVRLRAMNLLRRLDRYEGLWNSEVAAEYMDTVETQQTEAWPDYLYSERGVSCHVLSPSGRHTDANPSLPYGTDMPPLIATT